MRESFGNEDIEKSPFYKGYRSCGTCLEVLESDGYATHMQQVCNKYINDMYRTFFSKRLLESVLSFCALLQAVQQTVNTLR